MKADFKAYLVTGILTIVLLGGCAGQTSEKESVPSAGSPETIASGESELASSESVKDSLRSSGHGGQYRFLRHLLRIQAYHD